MPYLSVTCSDCCENTTVAVISTNNIDNILRFIVFSPYEKIVETIAHNSYMQKEKALLPYYGKNNISGIRIIFVLIPTLSGEHKGFLFI